MNRGELIKIIDNCRDILVGKIPDPITQVDQITIALIYKFMNDMDQEAIDMGGEASFFANDFEKYNWKNILDIRHGAQEMLNLYSEGITRIKENKNVPQLFKDILKEAYLPYNDPRILSLFLKEINKISYDDSESLGEAFEYLLSIMGSQGDAGQFRTPRHIIDFIVNIIKPQKGESILDPACGTAGFLISAFKYIQRENNYKLSSTEKETLSTNLVGYDIAPTMERLSKVNLYLHKLSNPKIYQYDTLSDEGFWENKYNIILANPPFMTPKGGISPHNKFSLKSNRSEVLFCDYINLHLKQNGRAGFIVPEGIIFKSDKAYKQLRKTLVEESLIAVISLPAGIFNPYSGVKTDILILDKKLHKETDKILFLAVNNDGYSLGKKRKPINENDLPESLQIFELFKQSIENHNYSKLEELNNKNVLLVDRETILKNENCDLSVNRYKEEEEINGNIENITFDTIIEFLPKSKRKASEGLENGKFPFYTSSQIQNKFINEADYNEECLIFGTGGSATIHIANDFSCSADNFVVKIKDDNIIQKYVYYYLLNNINILENGFTGSGLKHLSKSYLQNIQIPLPPLEIQEEIVKEIEGYEKIINGCREVVNNWKPRFEINEEWEKVKLENVCKKIFAGGDKPKNYSKTRTNNYQIPVYSNGIKENGLYGFTDKAVVNDEAITVSARGTIGFVCVRKTPFVPIIRLITAIPDKDIVMSEYLSYILDSKINVDNGSSIPQLTVPDFKTIKIPLPPLEIQQEIVAKIEEEKTYIDGCKKLIDTYQEKIKKVIDKVIGGEDEKNI